MNTFQKFFRYSRKLEELQTARKAKEVDEIRKFDVQMEAQKQRNLDQHLKFECAQAKQQIQALEHPTIKAEAWMTEQLQRLQEVNEFDEHVQHSKTDTSNNVFEQLVELQNSRLENAPDSPTALFSATYDVFANEISDVTESELQREFQQNDEAIYENQERPPHPQSTMLEVGPYKTELEGPFEEGLTIIDEEHLSEIQEKKAGRCKTTPSAGNVFYFRQVSSPPPKK
ncbi:hypothetical protein U27_04803 [Candidatus Vecturithrix granuli]|uniref:Uncharacterized protein n=1 Tax=Vecturithrix granuli TaxID=1499967 RepID=A0A081BZT1_VECG1|nr:hypothetical protein U27_04803 [Candidatus Vecturithrix granuli]